jgi:hypothetical protein
MLKTDSCPFCGEDGANLSSHSRTPEGEGCPYTPVTCSASGPAPSGDEGTERRGRSSTSGSGSNHSKHTAEGRDAANPATTLN